MTPSPRRHLLLPLVSPLVPARLSPRAMRPAAGIAAVLATLGCWAGLATFAPTAGAKVITVETTEGTEKVGIEARNAYGHGEAGENPVTFENPSGHPVLHAANTYAIYWDPTATYDGDSQELINEFFRNVDLSGGSLEDVFALDSQYRDSTKHPATTRSSYHGSYTDTNPYPVAGCTDPEALAFGSRITCLSNTQIKAQLQAFIAEHKLPKGMSTIYYLLTPPGVTVCLDEGGPTGHCSDHERNEEILEARKELTEPTHESYRDSFCSYHGAITPTNPETGDANTILYGMIPWTAGGVGSSDILPVLKAYDCQDGGFDPTTEPPGKKEAPTGVGRENEEAKERKEKAELETHCTQRLKEATETSEKEAIRAECHAELEKIDSEAAKEFQKVAKQEENEKPRIQEPNQIGVDLDGDEDAGLADVLTNEIAVQQQNIVTDPLLNAWHDSAGNEATDECRNDFWTENLAGQSIANEHTRAGNLSNEELGGAHYYLNNGFLLGALALDYPGDGQGCQDFLDLAPHFTAPHAVNSGEVVGFDGMESAISLNWAGLSLSTTEPTYATYSWNFGDGTPEVSGFAPGAPACKEPWLSPCAASVFHTYEYGGTYRVTLTVTDTGGNQLSTIQEINVNGPAKPAAGGGGGGAPAGGSAGGGGASSAGGSSAGSAGGATPLTTILPPTAIASAASTSIRNAIKRGLTIHYSVNEQVAGTVEVLLNATTAKHLHLRAPLATGLPAGSPASVVIGRAVLVTRKGGAGEIKLKLSKAADKALRKVKSVTLMLRVVARNASRTNPASTSLLSTFVLRH